MIILTFIGCKDVNSDRYVDSKIQTSVEAIQLSKNPPSSFILKLSTSHPWSVELSDTKSEPSWLYIIPRNGGAGESVITIYIRESHEIIAGRTTYLKIKSGVETKTLPIS